jgi:hypothetical protein
MITLACRFLHEKICAPFFLNASNVFASVFPFFIADSDASHIKTSPTPNISGEPFETYATAANFGESSRI